MCDWIYHIFCDSFIITIVPGWVTFSNSDFHICFTFSHWAIFSKLPVQNSGFLKNQSFIFTFLKFLWVFFQLFLLKNSFSFFCLFFHISLAAGNELKRSFTCLYSISYVWVLVRSFFWPVLRSSVCSTPELTRQTWAWRRLPLGRAEPHADA